MNKTCKQKFWRVAREVKILTFDILHSDEEREANKSYERGLMWRSILSQIARINLTVAYTIMDQVNY